MPREAIGRRVGLASTTPGYRRTLLPITCIGAMTAPSDSTMGSVSLPQMAADLDMDCAEVIWVPTAYLVTLAVTIAVMGRASDEVGRKSIFLTGVGVLTISSLLCSLSAPGTELFLFRIFRGFGGACIGSTSPDIVTETYPSNERGKAVGINARAV